MSLQDGGHHDGVDIPLPGSFWVGWGDQPKHKLCWGPWDYGTQEMTFQDGGLPWWSSHTSAVFLWALGGAWLEAHLRVAHHWIPQKMHTKIWPLIAKNMHRGGSAKVQAMLGSMGLRYAGNDVPGWRITMMELVIPGRIPMGTRWCLIGKNLVWRYEWVNEAVIQREMLCAVVDP